MKIKLVLVTITRLYKLLGTYLLALASLGLSAQSGADWQQLDQAERYITASRTDKALAVLDKLAERRTSPDFSLAVDYERTRALTKERNYPAAAAQLLPLIDEAHAHHLYAIEVKALLGMAYIHQRQHRPVECVEYLDRAEQLVKQHGLHSLSANVDNRRASYYRDYGDLKHTLRYANRALVVAREHEDAHQLALAHLLVSLALRNSSPLSSEQHLAKSTRYYHNTGSTVDYLVTTLVLNGLQIDGGRLAEALISNDSAMVYASKVEHRDSTYVSRVYNYRAQIMRAMGRPDSAWHYLNMAHRSELDHLKRINELRAVEVEAQYLNEKKSLLIAEQDNLLEAAKNRRGLLIWIVAISLVSFAILAYYYSRLSRAKSKLEQQYVLKQRNIELTHSLTEQKILQGEVHHRVKNNLQIIISLLELQMEELEDPIARESLETMAGRVYSMAAVHEVLYQNGRDGQVDFRLYAENICRHFEALYSPASGCEFGIEIEDFWFNLETAIPLGTMLNELLTNSFKYGVTPDKPLQIIIKLFSAGDLLCLKYRDNGSGYPEGVLREREGGLGTYLLNGMSRQLRGRVETNNHRGAVTRVFFQRKNDYKQGEQPPSPTTNQLRVA